MPKYKLVALTTPKEGREEEFHDWYNNKHIPEILAFPGFSQAQRFKLGLSIGTQPAAPWLAIYDLETDDLMGTLGKIAAARASGEMTPSDASSDEQMTAFYEEFTPVQFPTA